MDELGIEIHSATDLDAGEWDEFVHAHDFGTAYHRYAWRNIFSQALKASAPYFLARRDSGKICGVLPLVHLKSALFGNYCVSLPYANFGGALGDNAQIEEALMRTASEYAAKLGASHVEFRDTRPRDGNWTAKTEKVEMLRPLEADAESLLKGIGSKLRAQVKRPLREGATSRRGHGELLDDFYAVFAENMRDLGTPVHSKAFFRAIIDGLGESAELVTVYIQDRPVAGGLLIHHGEGTEIPSASSLRSYNRYSVNMYLYGECLKAAIERGSSVFDFGRSSPNSGTFRFKKQWGAAPQQLYWHYWLAEGQRAPNLNPNNPKYQLAIQAWTKLPVWLTKIIGPPIVRKLP